MRQEHAADDHSAEFFSTAPGTAEVPANRARAAARRPEETRRELMSTVTALAHTLAAPIATPEALQRALGLGLQLLPDLDALRLLVIDAGAGVTLRRIAHAERETNGVHSTIDDEAPTQTSLGYGKALDRQVLIERRSSRGADAQCIPLVGPTDTMLGVLVALKRTVPLPQLDPLLVALLADHLATLLDRRERERRDLRTSQVLQGLSAISPVAHLREQPSAKPNAQATEHARHDAEARILLQAADVLRDLAQPKAIVVCEVTPRGALRPFIERPDAATFPEQTALPLTDAAHTGLPVVLTPEQSMAVWQSLGALFAGANADSPHSEPLDAHDHVVALPVTGAATTHAMIVLALRTDATSDAAWLPAARAITAVAASNLAALHYAEEARAEGRARDAFISLTAHELRSPLTSIKGYAQLLIRQARKHPLPESMRRSVEAIEQQSVRMAEMVGELLDASRIQRGILDVLLGEVELVSLANKVVERRRLFAPQHAIDLRANAESLSGSWDAQRVEQVLRDLLDNASRYSPESERILIELNREGANAVVTVTDEGIGVLAEDRPHIFDYLYRAPTTEQRNLSGLGLGLFVCRHLAERMGGALELTKTSTEPPTGSTFRLTLPLA